MLRWREACNGFLAALCTAVALSGAARTIATPNAATTGGAATTGAISGVVTDARSGIPLARVFVRVSGGGMSDPARAVPGQVTDVLGRFLFTELPAGSYRVTGVAPGYLDGGYGQTPFAGGSTRVTVAAEQWFREANFGMWKAASLSGAVRDERGEPVVGIPVRLMAGVTAAGPQQWAAAQLVHTDDRGLYRFGNLVPGRYVVQVPNVQVTLPPGETALERLPVRQFGAESAFGQAPPSRIFEGPGGTGVVSYVAHAAGSRLTYPSTYHPRATVIDLAEPVDLDVGDARTAVDVTLIPERGVSVSGTVLGPLDEVSDLPVRLVLTGNEALGLGGETGLTKTDATGRFVFAQVPPATYRLIAGRTVSFYRIDGADRVALPPGANPFVSRNTSAPLDGQPGLQLISASAMGPGLSGELEIAVGNHPITGLAIAAVPFVDVSGHFLWDGSEAPPPQLAGPVVARLEAASGSVALGVYSALGTLREDSLRPQLDFTIRGVRPGRYVVGDANAASGHRVVGVFHRGRELVQGVLDVDGSGPVTEVVIRLSSRLSRVVGTVRGSDGRLAPAAVVFIFPTDARVQGETGMSGLRFRSLAVAASGAFEALNLPPGDYLMAAVPLVESHRAAALAFRSSLARLATRVTVNAGDTVTQDLRLLLAQR